MSCELSALVEPPDCTRDTLLRGRVTLFQPAKGYRSSLDPVLLAGFVAPPFGAFLDLGCASGALSFLLLAKDRQSHGVAVEIQPRLAELAQRGVAANGFDGRLEIVVADARRCERLHNGSFDCVVSNPPFRRMGTGVLPPSSEKAIANFEVYLTLSEWLDVAARALRPDGRLATVYPYNRSAELREALRARRMTVVRSRAVVARQGDEPSRILVEASRARAPERSEPPLVIHDGAEYSSEVKRMLGDGEP